MQNVLLNKKGVTLVEMMIALVILLIVFLALMQTALVSIGYNMNNVLRDEAVSIAESRMNDAKSLSYTALNTATQTIATSPTLSFYIEPSLAGVSCPQVPNPLTGNLGTFPSNGVVVNRNLKNVMNQQFCTNTTVTQLDNSTPPQAVQVTVTVGWTWKGQDFNHTFRSIVRQ